LLTAWVNTEAGEER